MTDEKTEAVIGCGLLIVSIPIGVLIRGWVLAILWGWFIVPITHLQPLRWAQAYGIALVAGLLISGVAEREAKGESAIEKAFNAIGYMTLYPLLVLGFGWCVKEWFLS